MGLPGEMPLKKLTAIKIAGVYALAGCLWILFSDELIARLFHGFPTAIKIITFKGWFFVGLTAWMLYIFIQREMGLVQRSEEALKDSISRIKDEQTKSQAMLNAIGDGICIIDKNFIVNYQNHIHQTSMGYHVGEHCYSGYTSNDTICEGCLVNMAFIDGRAHNAERSYPSNGELRYCETTASPLRDADDRIVAGIEIVRDITSRKKIESDLLRTKRLESIGILARGLSHDFNNLLTGILGNVSLAKTSLKPEDPMFTMLTRAEDSCLRAGELTYQLNTVAESDESSKKTLSVSGLLREAAGFALSDSQIECTYTIPDDIWPVTANEHQIGQAIYNVVVNSRDAMNNKGHITISAENSVVDPHSTEVLRKGNYVKITIADEGAGIEKELLPQIFDIYSTTKKLGSSKATGFSLAASYFAVKNHQGYIFAESTVGEGTTFSIYLPSA